ncbi:hypothetical protein AB836_00225 [Rickettsiales bacterium (ex Bugula neritina AB1)]|nr:hypothetical protein AB836_00225 [Rickettsiales bacterium (ex Bugula neritina AB1)]
MNFLFYYNDKELPYIDKEELVLVTKLDKFYKKIYFYFPEKRFSNFFEKKIFFIKSIKGKEKEDCILAKNINSYKIIENFYDIFY